MPKTVPESKFQEWEGLDRIQVMVHGMRCIYRELTKDDFGIDGEIEIVVPKSTGQGYETTGNILKFQAKSGKSYIKLENQERFFVAVKKDDLLLWHKSNHPTLFIFYHPGEEKLYWKDIQSYIKNTRSIWQPPYHIEFNKSMDEFTTNCHQKLSSLAGIDQPKKSYQNKERLISNLLQVIKLPPVWVSPTNAEDDDEIRFNASSQLPPFYVNENILYSFIDLSVSDGPLASWCDSKDVSIKNIEQLWEDKTLKRGYVEMLNQLLRSHLEKCNVEYAEYYHRYFFTRENQFDTEFKHSWTNIRNNRPAPSRITVKQYKYGYDQFWKHLAVDLNFKRIAQNWYIQISPRYYFTSDGVVPFDVTKVGSYTTKIKAKEVNYHVLNHVLFWADVLSWPGTKPENNSIIIISLNEIPVLEIDKMPCFGIVPFSIDIDPAIYEESQTSSQLRLMDWLENPDMEDEDED